MGPLRSKAHRRLGPDELAHRRTTIGLVRPADPQGQLRGIKRPGWHVLDMARAATVRCNAVTGSRPSEVVTSEAWRMANSNSGVTPGRQFPHRDPRLGCRNIARVHAVGARPT